MESCCGKLLSAAIDFGTAFSGYAFSFTHEYIVEPTKVSSKVWQSKTGLLASMKAPTCILLKPDKSFAAFGYEAENKYSQLALEDKHHEWYYFKRFKMMLFDKMRMSRNIELEDETGKSLPANLIFSEAIRFLKDDLLTNCKARVTDFEESDIHWVLTTPAKQFMREAAVSAGICGDDLDIALEPEAASIYCRHIPLERTEEPGKTSIDTFKPGHRYLVLDAGGGTVDITVHEVTPNMTVKELFQANGGPWGGTNVDEEFRQLLIKILGSPVILQFQKEHMEDYMELFREFELKKREIQPNSTDNITFRVPISLREIFEESTGENIHEAIDNMNIKGQVKWIKDKMQIGADLMKKFYETAINKIIEHLGMLLKKTILKSVSTILMVGGFSESMMLQSAVKSNFPKMKMIVPVDPGAAVLKGAVIFGHNPRAILERVCKYTYGVDISETFDSSVHDAKYKCEYEGVSICDNIFSKHVEVGETVCVGEPQKEHSYNPLTTNQEQMTFTIYTSTEKNPKYVTDRGCTKLGSLTVDMPIMTGDKSRKVCVQMFYSGTELGVEVTDETSGETVKGSFDFLG